MIRKTALVILTIVVLYICIDVMGNGSVIVPDDGDKETIIERMQKMYDAYWGPSGKQKRSEVRLQDYKFLYLGDYWFAKGSGHYKVVYYHCGGTTGGPMTHKGTPRILIYNSKDEIVVNEFIDVHTSDPLAFKIHTKALEISSGESKDATYAHYLIEFSDDGKIYIVKNAYSNKELLYPKNL